MPEADSCPVCYALVFSEAEEKHQRWHEETDTDVDIEPAEPPNTWARNFAVAGQGAVNGRVITFEEFDASDYLRCWDCGVFIVNDPKAWDFTPAGTKPRCDDCYLKAHLV